MEPLVREHRGLFYGLSPAHSRGEEAKAVRMGALECELE